MYKDDARVYKDTFNAAFDEYISSLDAEFTPEIKANYLNENLDKKLLFELDKELLDNIMDLR